MKKQFRPCRLEVCVHERLTAYAESIAKAKYKKARKPAWKTVPLVSLSEAVEHLLNQVDNHRARSRRAQLARKAGKADQAGAGLVGADQARVEVNRITSSRAELPPPPTF